MRYIKHKNPTTGYRLEWDDIKRDLTRMDGYDDKKRPLLGFPLPPGWSAWFNKRTKGMFYAVPSPYEGGDWQITEPIYDYDKFIKDLKYAVRLSQQELGEKLSRERIHGSVDVKKPFFFNRFLNKLSKSRENKERAFQHMYGEVKKEKTLQELLQRAAIHEASEERMKRDFGKQYQSWEDNRTNAAQLKKNPKRKTKKKKTSKKVARKIGKVVKKKR